MTSKRNFAILYICSKHVLNSASILIIQTLTKVLDDTLTIVSFNRQYKGKAKFQLDIAYLRTGVDQIPP
jgi:hypothetical protein